MELNILDLRVINCSESMYAQLKEKKSDVCYKCLDDISDNYDLLLIRDNFGLLRLGESNNYKKIYSIHGLDVVEYIFIKKKSSFNGIVKLKYIGSLFATIYKDYYRLPIRYKLIDVEDNILYGSVDELIKLCPLIIINNLHKIDKTIQTKLQDLFNITIIRSGIYIFTKRETLTKAAVLGQVKRDH
ncbi:hypothetical protein Hokovirus_1_296 [Hokovirus HKV1]|uniref:Uncharacterized protein n=1 Tax=Hokovirus HKV1 TaxID=1977638 RepID=A0A1V0SFC9_9VIRU|nr:hypothetical protein Hokovirus_1_296 [Hokovirus HKV1]